MENMLHGTFRHKLAMIQEKRTSFTEKNLANTVSQILTALDYLHKNKVIHHNLSLDNILVDLQKLNENETSMICKLTDYGFN